MELRQDIKKTIEYAKKFGATLNTSQLKKRLISKKIYDEDQIDAIAEKMGIDQTSIKNNQTNIKIKKTKSLVKLLSLNRNILFIGITGSVAFEQPNKEDDIDLMIITKVNKLWTTRLWLKLWVLSHNIPHRKYNQKEKGNEFCFNLWMNESSLLIPKNKQNLRNGLDLINVKKVLNRDQTWEKLIFENEWVKMELATPYSFLINKNNYQPKKNILRTDKITFWERAAFLIQILIIRSKRKNNLVDFNRAFFHDLVKKK